MQLRPYQQDAIDALIEDLAARQGNPIVALPTGTGKSVIIAEFVRAAFAERGNSLKIIMLTHVKELIAQNFEKLLKVWSTVPAGIYSAGLNRRELQDPITYAGISSIHSQHRKLGKVDYLVIDECHLVGTNNRTMYLKFIENLKKVNPELRVIGLSATPYRLGLGCLTNGGIFTHYAFDLTGIEAFNKLVEDGYLAKLINRRTKCEFDVSGVKVQGGEYVQSSLQMAVDKDTITKAAVQELCVAGKDRKHWLVFASGVEHAKHIGEELARQGISNCVITGDMPDGERDAALRDWKAGKYRAAVNNNILTTGVDFPGIDLIACLRATKSTALWVQMLGRGTRPSPGKENCLVMDFAGNVKTLGPINDPTIPKPKGTGGGQPPVRECPECGTYNHISLPRCDDCGNEFPPPICQLSEKPEITVPIVRTQEKVIEVIAVDRVSYARHPGKNGKPDSMRVTYYCNWETFSQYICLEHGGFAQRKAFDWLKDARTIPLALPMQIAETTVQKVLENKDLLKQPTHIKVWLNQKYPEILGVYYG